jgi:O-antigen/teichoic acid export membrane protein
MSILSKNIVYNVVGQFLRLVLGFISVRYVFRQLGGDALGIIYFSLTLNVVIVAALELGICLTAVREVSSHFDSEPQYIHALIRTGSLFFWSAYILIAAAILIAAPLIVQKWLHLEYMTQGMATQVLQILGISAVMALPRSFYAAILQGLERMEFNNLIDVATTMLQQAGIILILVLGGGILPVVWWIAASFLLGVLGYLLSLRYFFPWRALIPGFSSAIIKRNRKFTSKVMSLSVLSVINMQADKLILSKLLPISLVGYYGFVYGACTKATLLTSSVGQAAFPSYSALFKSGNRPRLLSQYRKIKDLAAIPFAALPILRFVFNPEIADKLLLPVIFICLGFYMNGTLNVPFVFSLAVGKPEITAKFYLRALFVTLPPTVILIYYFGLTGAALSWVLYHLFGYVYAMPKIYHEILETSMWPWYQNILKIFALAGMTYGLGGLLLRIIKVSTLFYLGFTYILGSVVFLLGAYFMLGEELRETIDKLIYNKLKGIIFKVA